MNKYIKLAAVLLLATVVVSCEKEKEKTNVQFNFIGNLEKSVSDSTDSRSKVTLLNEQWINWEIGDIISIGSDQTSGSEHYDAYLVRTVPGLGTDFDEGFSAAFVSTLPENSKYFLALFPKNDGNAIGGTAGSTDFTATINLKAVQPVRHDSSFAREVYPMVAWYGGEWTTPEDVPYNLDFHSLGGLVRLQLFNNSGVNKSLKEIRITSRDSKQLVGRFNVVNYKTNDPHLESIDNVATNQTLTISCGSGLEFNANTLRTFYVILPALGGRLTSTTYPLTMTVETIDGGTCSRDVTVHVRRTGLTNIRALGINAWTGSGSAAGLAGNGTAERPFKVYTLEDLVYLRNAYNSSRRINGQPVTRNTHIRIMRSDITIPNDDRWSAGIQNFCGHLTCVSNTSAPGISTINRFHPLFESISDSGVVEGLVLKSEVNYNENNTFSSFCFTNRGTMKDCVLTNRGGTGITNTTQADLAGLCIDNYGTIDGCRCEATLQAPGHIVAGICMNNASATAVITGCQITSPMTVTSATKVGGVCYSNTGIVKDSYFAATISSSAADWGGIVFTNSGTVEHCANMGIINTDATASVGGVVNSLTGGTVNYCYSEGKLRGGQVGGIANAVTGGTIINSFINHTGAQITLLASSGEHGAGGIAATLNNASIKNCFVYFPHIDDHDLQGHVGGIVGHAINGTIDHCYAYETNYGSQRIYGVSESTECTSCYLVDGVDQTGVTPVSTTAPADAFVTMQANLNLNPPAGAKEWEGAVGNTTPPHLKAYSPTSKRRR